jgi:hypothetical protein
MIRSARHQNRRSLARRIGLCLSGLRAGLATPAWPTHRSRLWAKAVGFRRDQRGSAAILFAFAMPMLIGAMGLGFEVSNWYMRQRAMQNAADAAVLAAVTNGTANYAVEAKAVAAQYGFTSGVTVVNGVTCPAGGTACYRATITGSVPLYLSPVVGYAGNGGGLKTLTATATAGPGTYQRPYCILGLGVGGARGITSSGGSNVDLSGCNVKSNTDAKCDNTDINADYGDAVGANLDCGVIQSANVPVSPDPYNALKSNIPTNTCGSYPQGNAGPAWTGTKNLSGNTIICGDLRLTGAVTVNAAASGAVLVIENGRLDTNGFTIKTSSGSGLTIVFSGTTATGYTHAPTDNGTVDIVAPTSGPWSGVAIYQDPKLTSGVDINHAGGSPIWKITGLVYLPNSDVVFDAAVSKATNGLSCFVLVAGTVAINNNGSILSTGQCVAAGLAMPTGTVAGRGVLVN